VKFSGLGASLSLVTIIPYTLWLLVKVYRLDTEPGLAGFISCSSLDHGNLQAGASGLMASSNRCRTMSSGTGGWRPWA
jgi:hypothetical protein